MSNGKIIKFPGAKADSTATVASEPAKILSKDQDKAISLILSGQTFILISMKPTDTGSDFFTAMHGDNTELRNAEEHLPGVIRRLYERKGIV